MATVLTRGEIRSGAYFDSVTLMIAGRDLTATAGVVDAAVVMATPENKAILRAAGLWLDTFDTATGADLLVAVKATTAEAAAAAVRLCGERLRQPAASAEIGGPRPASLPTAIAALSGANLALVSVAGRYAAREARQALEAGLHVMLFSDNVSVESEIELKELARAKGLLLMGPDCGTAILNGAPLGFANAVRRGRVGLVAAAGTGAQEISSRVSNEGAGISQVIGTGGRDVTAAIGGIMFLEGLRALAEDPETAVIVLVAKPPAAAVLERIGAEVRRIAKPVVAAFVGADPTVVAGYGMVPAATLEEAALLAAALSTGAGTEGVHERLRTRERESRTLAGREVKRLAGTQKYLRALFCGGTFCAEAQVMLQRAGTLGLHSNVPFGATARLEDVWKSTAHTLIDFGEDAFTVGRPHPMIDYALRNRRIELEAADPECAVLLLDVVLGYGANEDPVSELAGPLSVARGGASETAGHPIVACSVTGTPNDPQDGRRVVDGLRQAGALVLPSNAAAVQFAAHVLGYLEAR